MRKVLLGICLLTGFGTIVHAADLNLSASSLKIKLYKFAVSTSPLCTNLQTIVDNGNSPVETQLLGGANLGSGTVGFGTYPCVVLEMSDRVKYNPSANSTSGNCQMATEVTRDLCHNGDTSRKVDGTVTTCGTSTDDRVGFWISTAATGAGDSFNRPTTIGDTQSGASLASALVVSGASSHGTFVVNPTGHVCDDNTAGCDGSSGGTGTGGAGLCHLDGVDISFSH